MLLAPSTTPSARIRARAFGSFIDLRTRIPALATRAPRPWRPARSNMGTRLARTVWRVSFGAYLNAARARARRHVVHANAAYCQHRSRDQGRRALPVLPAPMSRTAGSAHTRVLGTRRGFCCPCRIARRCDKMPSDALLLADAPAPPARALHRRSTVSRTGRPAAIHNARRRRDRHPWHDRLEPASRFLIEQHATAPSSDGGILRDRGHGRPWIGAKGQRRLPSNRRREISVAKSAWAHRGWGCDDRPSVSSNDTNGSSNTAW